MSNDFSPSYQYRSLTSLRLLVDAFDCGSIKDEFDRDLFNYFFILYRLHEHVDSSGFANIGAIEERLKADRVPWRMRVKLVVKALVNWFFLFCFKFFFLAVPKYKTRFVVKTWIDVNYSDFCRLTADDDHFVLVLPFPLGVNRQLRYLLDLYRKDVNFCIVGLPFRLSDILRFARVPSFYNHFWCNHNASLGFSKLVNHQFLFQHYYTMDDVDPFNFSSNMALKNQVGVTTILHGIGTYSPILSCDELYCFNQKQAEFYACLNSEIKFVILNEPALGAIDTCFTVSGILVFLSAITEASPSDEIRTEFKILAKLKKICDNLQVDFYVKRHPNLINETLFKDHMLVSSIEDNVVVCSLYSTGYYTFGSNRSFLIDTGDFLLADLFGEAERVISEATLAEYLYDLFNQMD